jgi:hypothetical protein
MFAKILFELLAMNYERQRLEKVVKVSLIRGRVEKVGIL